ncbi:hypothetical protein [Chelativorans sp.]|uniref:hypothetical protein n=1 Tax=Chelativorans sp. TaxID=2203393 RepID=UPI002811EEA4|nr:hypothetical protein [Chelativorans sp.]
MEIALTSVAPRPPERYQAKLNLPFFRRTAAILWDGGRAVFLAAINILFALSL